MSRLLQSVYIQEKDKKSTCDGNYLTETILGTDFVEVPGGIGNDAAAYLIYEDGRIHARQESDKKEADKKSSITTETAGSEGKKIR